MRAAAVVTVDPPGVPECNGCASCGDCSLDRLFVRTSWTEWLCVPCWDAAGRPAFRHMSGSAQEVASAHRQARENRAEAERRMLARKGPDAYLVKAGRT